MLHPAAIFGICFGSYIVLAILAVQLLPPCFSAEAKKKKRAVKFPTWRIGHRGGSLNGPENTMWTFRRTESDLDVIELDVALTSDGVVVVTHDRDLDRQCAVPERTIDSYTFNELPPLAAKIPLHFPSNSQESYRLAEDKALAAEFGLCTEQQRFPTLREVFEGFPNKPIHLDCKFTSDNLVLQVLDLIEQFDRCDKTIVGSASGPNVGLLRKEVKRRNGLKGKGEPKFLTFASAGEVASTYILYWLGLLPLIPLSYDAFSIPLMTDSKREMIARRKVLNPCLRCIGAFIIHAPSLWRHLQRRGIVVLGFVLNDVDEWDEVKDWPIDGIMTDDPAKMNRHFTICCARGDGRCSCPEGHSSVAPSAPVRAEPFLRATSLIADPVGYGSIGDLKRQKSE